MSEAIENIDPVRAQKILSVVARSSRQISLPTEVTPELWKELASAFCLSECTTTKPASEDELVKQALSVLAEDPERRAAIETMAAQPDSEPQKFDFGASLSLTAAVMIVLQTHLRFERQEDGKWSVKVEKKPTSDALLKGLVQKLLAYVK